MGLLWENSFWVFFFLTVVIGGAAAFLSGRSLAAKWRSPLQPCLYMLLLGLAVRFFHFALFDGTLLSVHYYAADTLVLILIALLGYRLTIVRQMAIQYPWIYERVGLFWWREIEE